MDFKNKLKNLFNFKLKDEYQVIDETKNDIMLPKNDKFSSKYGSI